MGSSSTRLVARLEAAPGIAGATPVNVRPFSGEGGWDVPRFTWRGADRAAANPFLNGAAVPGHAEMLVLRTSAPTGSAAMTVRQQIGRVDPDVKVMRVAFSESLRGPLPRPRFHALVLGVFAAAASRAIRHLLFEIQPLDPATLARAAILLIAASILASYVPMRRAAGVDATAVLRE